MHLFYDTNYVVPTTAASERGTNVSFVLASKLAIHFCCQVSARYEYNNVLVFCPLSRAMSLTQARFFMGKGRKLYVNYFLDYLTS